MKGYDGNLKTCRACDGNPKELMSNCHFCELRLEWKDKHVGIDNDEDEITQWGIYEKRI